MPRRGALRRRRDRSCLHRKRLRRPWTPSARITQQAEREIPRTTMGVVFRHVSRC